MGKWLLYFSRTLYVYYLTPSFPFSYFLVIFVFLVILFFLFLPDFIFFS